jgi:hypothetical protein
VVFQSNWVSISGPDSLLVVLVLGEGGAGDGSHFEVGVLQMEHLMEV